MVEFTNGQVLPSVRKWAKAKVIKLGYKAAESFLYFLDKYSTVMVGSARAMTKYYKNNHGKSLLDRLTASDIAYSILVYESACDVWEEEIIKSETCETREEKKAFPNEATLKHHVKRGTRIVLFQDGWKKEGGEYFISLCHTFDELKKLDKIWGQVQNHWETYTRKYHTISRYECDNAVHNNYDDDCGEGENSEDDCIISLPDEMGNNSFDDDLDYNSGEDDIHTNKRQRTCV